MADAGIDAVFALVNTLVCQILALRELEVDARELHRQLGSLRGLLESVQLTTDGERALATPEANRALAVSVKAGRTGRAGALPYAAPAELQHR